VADAADITEQIADNAAAPASTETDGMKTVEHPLPDQIAAAKFLEQREAAAGSESPWLSLRPARVLPVNRERTKH
jgi:hypothetical protein